jgi:hypothetical protein
VAQDHPARRLLRRPGGRRVRAALPRPRRGHGARLDLADRGPRRPRPAAAAGVAAGAARDLLPARLCPPARQPAGRAGPRRRPAVRRPAARARRAARRARPDRLDRAVGPLLAHPGLGPRPALRTALPAALQAAGRGDVAPLLRLALGSTGGGQEENPVNDVRFLATTCTEGNLPWAPESDPATRPACSSAR